MVKRELFKIRLLHLAPLVHQLGLLTCLVGTLTVLGCGGGAAKSELVLPKSLTSITITPGSADIVVNGTAQFKATGNYSDGSTQDLTSSVAWASSTTSVATISASGLATSLTVGQSSISAGLNSLNASAATLVVTAQGSGDPLGSAGATTVTCPSSSIAGTCYSVVLSCPEQNIADFTGFVKVSSPTGTPVGTVVLTTGGTGDTLYESFDFGTTTLNTLLQGNFTTAQVTWGQPFTTTQPSGWVTGPGGTRALACRYATLARWVYDNIHLANTKAPFCATGNSSGGALIGLAMTHYGMGSIFAMVEPTSGPPFSRQDWGCDCLQPGPPTDPCGNPNTDYCAGTSNAQLFIDPAYAPPVSCSQEVMDHTTTYDPIFLSDSALSSDGVQNYPNTFVNFRYGSADLSGAPNQGHLWHDAILAAGDTNTAESCSIGAPHSIPNNQPGALDIANDILRLCKLP